MTLRRFSLRTRLTISLILLALPFLGCVGVGVYYLEKSARLMGKVGAILKPFADGKVLKKLKPLEAQAREYEEGGLRNLLLAAALATALGMTVGFVLWRNTTRPLRVLWDLLRAVETGDLKLSALERSRAQEVASLVERFQDVLVESRTLAAERKDRIILLRERLDALADALARLGLGLVLTDEHGVIVQATQAANNLCANDLPRGRTVAGAGVSEALQDALLAPLRHGGSDAPVAVDVPHREGPVRLQVVARPVLGAAGERRGVIALLWAAQR